MRTKFHLVSPYLVAMSSIVVIYGAAFSGYYFANFDSNWPKYSGGIGVPILTIIFVAVLILDGREFLSFYAVSDDVLRFYTPFRKTIHIDLRKCAEIGIDYGVISGGVKQYWMYFSMKPVSASYFHKITRTKYTRDFIRIQYSEEKYHFLLSNCSFEVRKRLMDAHSVIDNQKRKGNGFSF